MGEELGRGSHLLLAEMHSPKNVIPILFAPLVFVTSLITQYFGGSAGREGAVVQMSASLADQLTYFFPQAKTKRKAVITTARPLFVII